MTQDIRWQQRFDNFSKAFYLLKEALDQKKQSGLSPLEQEGLIQRFEYTYELAWKVLKDYLEYTGIAIEQPTPRFVIKKAFASQIITDGQAWIDMLEARNAMSHVYNREKFESIITLIETRFFALFKSLYHYLLEPKNDL